MDALHLDLVFLFQQLGEASEYRLFSQLILQKPDFPESPGGAGEP